MSRIYKGKRTPMLYQCGGKKMTVYQWAAATGLPYSTIQQRIVRGVRLDTPKSKRGRPVGSTNAKEVKP